MTDEAWGDAFPYLRGPRDVAGAAHAENEIVLRYRAALRWAIEAAAHVWVDGVEVPTADGGLIVREEALAAFDAAPEMRDADRMMTTAQASWTALVLAACAVVAARCEWRTFAIDEAATWSSSLLADGGWVEASGRRIIVRDGAVERMHVEGEAPDALTVRG